MDRVAEHGNPPRHATSDVVSDPGLSRAALRADQRYTALRDHVLDAPLQLSFKLPNAGDLGQIGDEVCIGFRAVLRSTGVVRGRRTPTRSAGPLAIIGFDEATKPLPVIIRATVVQALV